MLWNNPNGSQSNMLDYLAGAAKIKFVITIMIEEFDTIYKVKKCKYYRAMLINVQSEIEEESTAGAYKIGIVNKLVCHSKSVQGLVPVDNNVSF